MNPEIDDELEDFDLPEPTYEVWATCYTAADTVLSELSIYKTSDPDDAVLFTDAVTVAEVLQMNLGLTAVPDYILLEVETIIDSGNHGNPGNPGTSRIPAGTIYRRRLVVEVGMIREIEVDESDLTFDDNGLMFIPNANFPAETLLRVTLKPDSQSTCARTIIYKVVGFKANGILCEFAE